MRKGKSIMKSKRDLLLALAGLAFSAVVLAADAAVHVPGLVQAKFTGSSTDKTSDIASSSTLAYAAGPIMANTSGSAKDWNGSSWSWGGNTVFGYLGEMWVEAGTTYTFGKSVDDWTYIVVDGTTVIDNGQYNSILFGSYTATETGWTPIEIRVGNGGGGAGLANSAKYGVAYNTVTNTVSADFKAASNGWTALLDPGDCSLLRVAYSDADYATIEGVAVDGADLVVTASFTGLAGAGTLTAFYGAGDGETTPGDWDANAVAATPAAGDTASAQYRVAGAGSAAFVAFRLSATVGTSTPIQQWSDTYALALASPAFKLVNTDVGYTNLSYTATCIGLGQGASSVDIDIELATDAAFSNVVQTKRLALAGLGSEAVAFIGLTTNTTYYARVVGTNDQQESGASSTVSKTTLDPGFATGTITFASGGFASLTFTCVVTEWGAGSSSADLTLEVSTSDGFSAGSTLSFPATETATGSLPSMQALMATGLTGNTAYHVRLRIVNTWGLETIVTLATTCSTIASPVKMSDPFATPAGDGVETLGISCLSIEAGASYSVSLSVDGATVRSWSGQTAVADFVHAWSGPAGSSHAAVFTVSSNLGGAPYSETYPLSFTVGGTVAVVSDLSDLGSMILRVGDTLVLPALGAGESIVYDTNDVVSFEGTVFLAKEPGANRIRRYAPDPATGNPVLSQDGVLIVAPKDEDLHGGLFVSRKATSGNLSWCNASSWEKIYGDHDWPNGAGDVALIYLPLTSYTVTVTLNNSNVTVGYLGLGSTHSGNQVYLSNGSLTFQTSDGSESWLRMAGRNEGAGNLTVGTEITLANDLFVDGMGAKDMGLTFNGSVNVGNHVLTLGRVPFRSSGDRYTDGQIQFKGDVTGTGEIRLRADSTASLGSWPARKTFQGTWNPAACNHNGNYGGAALFLGRAYLGHAARELKVSGAWYADKDKRKGASVRTGWSNSYQFTATTNYWRGGVMPPKVTLDGGELNLITQGPLDAKYKDDVREDWYEIGEFHLATGPMGRLWSGISTWHDGCYPNTHTVVTNLVVESGATASLGLDVSANRNKGIISNDFHVVNRPAAAWDSGKGYEILPFFFVNAESTDRTVVVRETATGRVTKVTPDNTDSSTDNIRELGSNGKNASMADGSEWEAVTVYPWAYGYFAQPNSTVKIHSGYLNIVRTQFAPADHANSASSTVDFGNRTASVYVNCQNDTAVIGCRISGTGGFVKSAGGTLRLHQPMDALTGGVWINAGRLSLTNNATFGANNVSVAAGAKLRIAGVSPFATDARLDLENREWLSVASHIELDTAIVSKVGKLYVNGENWWRGYYGSSDSDASLVPAGAQVFINDEHFSGTGWIRVLKDDLTVPIVIRLK